MEYPHYVLIADTDDTDDGPMIALEGIWYVLVCVPGTDNLVYTSPNLDTARAEAARASLAGVPVYVVRMTAERVA